VFTSAENRREAGFANFLITDFMRLKRLNISGFKSFVDPTVITVPADFTGIVGPNGCGKSNVIDAVRWVMGEISARNLRGENMSDVIFNGSAARKPVGKASVELIFDNSEGTAPGNYAGFSEIAVRRTLSRDGTSQYIINRSRCRRRDITDLFRGTGLGHRSYSIIEQGMVSRIVEARPEDLRSFVEEAAGISRYKDRRRETETRIRHTRENLDRVEDIRGELAAQLRRLQRQSQAARRYQKLKDEERLITGQLLGVRYREMKQRSVGQARRTSEAQNRVESELAQQRSLERQAEDIRSGQVDSQNQVNEIQGEFYSVGADVASVEQKIEHTRETEQQQRGELERLTVSLAETSTQLEQDVSESGELDGKLSRNEMLRGESVTCLEKAQDQLVQHEHRLEDWQERWHEFTQRAAEPARDQEVQKARIDQFESVDLKLQERLARLDDENMKLLGEEETLDLENARSAVWQQDETVRQKSEALQRLLNELAVRREAEEKLDQEFDTARQGMHTQTSRLETLEDLQERALRQDDEYRSWLEKRGLSHAPRLTAEIDVAEGWEVAADAVLGRRLAGLGVGSLENAVADETTLPASDLFFIESRESGGDLRPSDDTLLSKLSCRRYDFKPLLEGVYVVETLPQAIARRSELATHECVVTRCGTVIGQNWIRAPRGHADQMGLLAREEEIEQLRSEVSKFSIVTAELKRNLGQTREAVRDTEQQHQSRQKELGEMQAVRDELRQQLAEKEARFGQIEARRQQLLIEIDEAISDLESTGQELDQAGRSLALAQDETGSVDDAREHLLEEKQTLSSDLIQARRVVQECRDQLHQNELDLQVLRASLESLRAAQERLASQSRADQERHDELQKILAQGSEPEQVLQQRLQELLDKRVEVDARLASARSRLDLLDENLRANQGLLSECEQRVAVARESLEEQRLLGQELNVRAETLVEQITADDYVLDDLLADLPDDTDEATLVEKSQQLGEKISRIGAVNLVAIEEFEEQSERKSYLDEQHADLAESLETLQNAIRKIDRETRERFRNTFSQLNEGFTEFFPKLFGGGTAVLELTDDDLLTAGVVVMARPPGKRNSSIHLLSGGEKALAAVALLFALFRLNPAPFCILDEVDAPLDDLNVARYCQTLRTLSERSQLIVITHNKITMESADVLLGVTMGEPGVSAIVSVDIDQALEMAAQ
jgi:chromosome segregation protein